MIASSINPAILATKHLRVHPTAIGRIPQSSSPVPPKKKGRTSTGVRPSSTSVQKAIKAEMREKSLPHPQHSLACLLRCCGRNLSGPPAEPFGKDLIIAPAVTSKEEDTVGSVLLAPQQLGYGVKGGAEAAVHAARKYLSNMDPEHAMVKLDFRNAFNSICRDCMLQAVCDSPTIYPFVHSVYSSPCTGVTGPSPPLKECSKVTP